MATITIIGGLESYWTSNPDVLTKPFPRSVVADVFDDDTGEYIGSKKGTGLKKFADLPFFIRLRKTGGTATITGTTLDVPDKDDLTITSPSTDVEIDTLTGMGEVLEKRILILAGTGIISFNTSLIPVSKVLGVHNNTQSTWLKISRPSKSSTDYTAEFIGSSRFIHSFVNNVIKIDIDGQEAEFDLTPYVGGDGGRGTIFINDATAPTPNEHTLALTDSGKTLVIEAGAAQGTIHVVNGLDTLELGFVCIENKSGNDAILDWGNAFTILHTEPLVNRIKDGATVFLRGTTTADEILLYEREGSGDWWYEKAAPVIADRTFWNFNSSATGDSANPNVTNVNKRLISDYAAGPLEALNYDDGSPANIFYEVILKDFNGASDVNGKDLSPTHDTKITESHFEQWNQANSTYSPSGFKISNLDVNLLYDITLHVYRTDPGDGRTFVGIYDVMGVQEEIDAIAATIPRVVTGVQPNDSGEIIIQCSKKANADSAAVLGGIYFAKQTP